MNLETVSKWIGLITLISGTTYGVCNVLLIRPLEISNAELKQKIESDPYKKAYENLVVSSNALARENGRLDTLLGQWKASHETWQKANETCRAQLQVAQQSSSILQHIDSLKREKSAVESSLVFDAKNQNLLRQAEQLQESIKISESKLSCQ